MFWLLNSSTTRCTVSSRNITVIQPDTDSQKKNQSYLNKVAEKMIRHNVIMWSPAPTSHHNWFLRFSVQKTWAARTRQPRHWCLFQSWCVSVWVRKFLFFTVKSKCHSHIWSSVFSKTFPLLGPSVREKLGDDTDFFLYKLYLEKAKMSRKKMKCWGKKSKFEEKDRMLRKKLKC